MLILAVDTSGNTASAAVTDGETLLGSRMVYTARSHSQILLPMVKSLLADTGHTVQEADIFAAANGPGSYTGLRIGISAMQALAFAGEKKCAGISTLEGLAWNCAAWNGIICATLHARQDICYTAVFRSDGQKITRLTDDAVLKAAETAEMLKAYEGQIMAVGDGYESLAPLCGNLVQPPLHLRAQNAVGIAMAALHAELLSPEQMTVRYLQAVKIG